jgi:peptidoglycan hydrolase CwlO-like protein
MTIEQIERMLEELDDLQKKHELHKAALKESGERLQKMEQDVEALGRLIDKVYG